ncbi:nitroreductase family deazaflavin-dependent oxidoreductase [soil metagenome]
MSRFNDKIVAEFRANNGYVETNGFRDTLIILHTLGAQSGRQRVNPVMALPNDDGSWVIAAAAKGSPKTPGWAANLRAQPDARIETGSAEIDVRAEELAGPERDAAWARFVDFTDAFLTYQEQAGRLIPLIKLTPR